MSAQVQEESVWVASCHDCDWYSEPYEDETDAEVAKDRHNDARHEG